MVPVIGNNGRKQDGVTASSAEDRAGAKPGAAAGVPDDTAAKLASLLSSRRLTPAQSRRLARLRKAAQDLATEGGYAAVTMRAVAERAQVGLATVYRYFSSKDHLIADVHAAMSEQIIARLRKHPLQGETSAERVAAVFDHMLYMTSRNLKLASAGVSAITSGDAIAGSPQYWHQVALGSYLDIALGDEEVGDRLELGEILGHVFFSLMVGMTAGRNTLAQCQATMRRAVHLILDRRSRSDARNLR